MPYGVKTNVNHWKTNEDRMDFHHCDADTFNHQELRMTIPPALQDRLIEVLRTAHDNALEMYQDAQVRYKGYKQHRIDALGAEAVEVEMVLFEILELRGPRCAV